MSNFCHEAVPGVNGAPTPCSKSLPCRDHPNSRVHPVPAEASVEPTVERSLGKLFDLSADHILENQKLRHAGAELLQTVHDLRSHQKSIQFCDLDPCTRMCSLFVKQTKKEPSR